MKTYNKKVDDLINKMDKGHELKHQDLVCLNEMELNLLRIFKKIKVDAILHPSEND